MANQEAGAPVLRSWLIPVTGILLVFAVDALILSGSSLQVPISKQQ